jgi:proline iminopeptidase
LFPDAWEQFLEPLAESEYADPVTAYQRRLNGSDELERLRAARAWSLWEGALYSLTRKPATQNHFGATHVALSLARIENHYVANQLFLEQDQLLRDIDRLAGIPGTIVQGRYDVICPMDQAWALRRAWPDAELHIVPAAGHAASEPGIIDALVRATRAYASLLQ